MKKQRRKICLQINEPDDEGQEKTTGKRLETRDFRCMFKDLEELVAFSPLTDRKVQVSAGLIKHQTVPLTLMELT